MLQRIETIETECGKCAGTGLFRRHAERAGVAIVCEACSGSGCKVVTYIPFTGRYRRSDVLRVHALRGPFLGPSGRETRDSVSYEEFLEGRRPGDGKEAR